MGDLVQCQCKIEYVAIGSKRDYTLEHNVGSNLHKHWSIESERQWILSCVRSDRAEPAEFNVPPICCLLRTLYKRDQFVLGAVIG